MNSAKSKLFITAEWLFLAGIALLIVRNNIYPWAIKRASDIFFLASILTAFAFIVASKEWKALKEVVKKISLGGALILLGLFIASAAAHLIHDVTVDSEGWLNLFRFIEGISLAVAAGFFMHLDHDFLKKAAYAQLSTLIYLVTYFFPVAFINRTIGGRFAFLENWPSNVGYYLIVSLSFFLIQLFVSLFPFSKKIFLYYIAASGLTGILLWTNSRASWLAFCVITIGLLLYAAYRKPLQWLRRIFIIGAVLCSLFASFFFLPKIAQSVVILRFFPGAYRQFDINDSFFNIVGTIHRRQTTVNLSEPSRLFLWPAYLKALAREPWGFGLSYFPKLAITYQSEPKGPHNTPLEMLATGGAIALFGFITLFVLAFKNIVLQLRRNAHNHWLLYLFVSLTALTVVSFFDNMSSFRLTWIMLGLALYFKSTLAQNIITQPQKSS